MVNAKVKEQHSLIKAISFALLRSRQESARNILIQQTKSVSDLVGGDCSYALHALLLSLVSDDSSVILQQMTSEKVKVLKCAVAKARKLTQPDLVAVNQTVDNCYTKVRVPSLLPEYGRLKNEQTMVSGIIAKEVCALWDDAVAELDKWADTIANFQKKPCVKSDDKHITLEQLMNKLGMSYSDFRKQRSEIIKNNPGLKQKINSWFCHETGTRSKSLKLFDIEHFDELQQLITVHKSRNKTVRVQVKQNNLSENEPVFAQNEIWRMEELAEKLGRTKQELINDKFYLLKVHKDLADTIENWFVLEMSTDALGKKRKIKFFVASHFDEFAALLRQHKKYKSRSKQTRKPEKVSDDVVETFVPKQPKNGLEVQALQVFLTELNKMLEQASADEKKADELCAKLDSRLQVAKQDFEKAKVAKQNLIKKIESVNDLINEHLKLEEEARAAAQKLSDKKAQIAQFMTDCAFDKK
jgi:hypothetical protein